MLISANYLYFSNNELSEGYYMHLLFALSLILRGKLLMNQLSDCQNLPSETNPFGGYILVNINNNFSWGSIRDTYLALINFFDKKNKYYYDKMKIYDYSLKNMIGGYLECFINWSSMKIKTIVYSN